MSNEYRIHPPESDTVTAYDRRCFKLYIMLMDADVAGTEWSETYRQAFGREISKDRKRAHRQYLAHLERARWMAAVGYAQLSSRA